MKRDDEKIEELKAMPLRERCYAQAKAMGWYVNPLTGEPKTNTVERSILLIDDELSEAHEGLRKDATDKHLPHRKSFDVEIADAWIRCHDTLWHWKCLRWGFGVFKNGIKSHEGLLSAAKYALWDKFRSSRGKVERCAEVIECGADALGIPLMDIVREKLDFNLTRADHQLANRAKEGGKKQ